VFHLIGSLAINCFYLAFYEPYPFGHSYYSIWYLTLKVIKYLYFQLKFAIIHWTDDVLCTSILMFPFTTHPTPTSWLSLSFIWASALGWFPIPFQFHFHISPTRVFIISSHDLPSRISTRNSIPDSLHLRSHTKLIRNLFAH